MAKQTFTAGQVLTAAQMTSLQANDYNWTTSAQTASYVLTAANAGQTVTITSASATTITVNTSLFTAGDTVRILNLGAGACTVTAGTATVNTAGSLVLPQYGSGTLWFSSASAAIFIPDDRNAGLTLIKTQTIGTAVSSVTVSDVFSATYDNYLITINGGAGSGTGSFFLTLGATATGYYFGANYATYAGTSGVFSGANTTRIEDCCYYSVNAINMQMVIKSPFLADHTTFNWQVSGAVASSNNINTNGGGYLANDTSYTAFTLTASSGTVTGGTIRVYGYQNS